MFHLNLLNTSINVSGVFEYKGSLKWLVLRLQIIMLQIVHIFYPRFFFGLGGKLIQICFCMSILSQNIKWK